jgi:hypothetical protein
MFQFSKEYFIAKDTIEKFTGKKKYNTNVALVLAHARFIVEKEERAFDKFIDRQILEK